MARRSKDGVNKSEEIRKILKANPKISAKEAVAALGEQGVEATEGLFYFIKGKVKGRKGRRKKAGEVKAMVAKETGDVDAVKTILKIKGWANELGGLKKLKALVDALSEN